MALFQATVDFSLQDANPVDTIFRQPNIRNCYFTFWLATDAAVAAKIVPQNLTSTVLIKPIGYDTFGEWATNLFGTLISNDSTFGVLYNLYPIAGITDIGLRLAYSAPPLSGRITCVAFPHDGSE